MLQIIGLLAISWLLLWFFEKKDLSVLGFKPSKDRVKYFIILFIVSAAIASSGFLLRMYIAKEEYILSPSLTAQDILMDTWYQIRTVLTEELLCRGVLLYILIKKIGPTKAVIFSSIVFAALHWLNAGVWGDMMQMVIVFTFTFAMGLLLAFAYARTYSLLIPFAIHLGWNFAQNYIFPDTSTGHHIFTLAAPPPTVTISYLAFFTMLLFPKVAVIIVDYVIVKGHSQVDVP